jgi:putative restriction endonuclease
MNDFIKDIGKLKVNRVGQVISLHKPLLLLLTISEIYKGHKNLFLFDDIESELAGLISKYGLKNTNKINAQYPFIYLATNSDIWTCSKDKSELIYPDAASRKEILDCIGSFKSGFYNFLLIPDNALKTIQLLLNQYWPDAYHTDILNDIGIFDFNLIKQADKQNRGKKFIENVLDAYERKCAICHQSIRLGDSLIGIDACHLKPIQHYGEDLISNGLALCKMHHWALDRGAISINNDMKLLVSPKLNGNKLSEYFTEFNNVSIFQPRNIEFSLSKSNIKYHYEYIFVK